MLRRPGQAAGEGELGLTVVELAVSIAITSVLTIALCSLMIGLSKSVRYQNGTIDTTAEARVATTSVSRTLRVALSPGSPVLPIALAKSDTISFYAALDRGQTPINPTLVTFSWNGSCLTRTQVAGVAILPVPTTGNKFTFGAAATAACMLRSTTAPVFSYYDSATGTAPLTVPPAGLADTSTVKSVQVTATATTSSANGRVSTSKVVDRVVLANCTLPTSTTTTCAEWTA